MDWIKLKEKSLPVVADVDVVVAGGGCAGVGAAVAAARNGARVFLAERMFCLGGMMTAGLMSKIAIAPQNLGFATELIKRLDMYQGTNFHDSRPEVPIDPEVTKLLLDKIVIEESKVDVRFGTVVTGAVTTERQIEAVILSGIEGEQAVRAKYYIDCTGDGQLAYTAGAPCMTQEGDEYSSSPTLMFRIANCDIDKMLDFFEDHPELFGSTQTTYNRHRMTARECRAAIANDVYAHMADFIKICEQGIKANPGQFTEDDLRVLRQRGILFLSQPQPGHVLVNATTVPNWRGTTGQELSRVMVEMRKQCETLHRLAKAFIPGFADSYLMDTAGLMGIRESRRVEGDYIFTQEDVESLRRFDDAICSNHGGVEIHKGRENSIVIRELGDKDFYDVPYRSVIAKGFDNLFMAGRCFSATHPALSAARNIAYCCALGEACGSAAALLTKSGETSVRAVNIKSLQKILANTIGTTLR
jgi:glycine/D-amino acid oxidase-like deaminating enzyme